MYFLYYAGMAQDHVNEQIGLATSPDGIHFDKVDGHGLILPRDPETSWKAERVCNPTVLYHNHVFVMYYQGIASGPLNHTSIARAHSKDGIHFQCDAEPCISWQVMEHIDPSFNPNERVGLFEPTVFIENNTYFMWFVYAKGTGQNGNDIYFAESTDGIDWHICENKILNGSQFGPFRVHYPQVFLQNGQFEIWFSLKSLVNASFGIFKMTSFDGQHWENLQQVLPQTTDGLSLTPRKLLNIKINEKKVRWGSSFDYLYTKVLRKYFHRYNYLGFAHPHVITSSNSRSLYLHNYNMGSDGSWMDISRCELTKSGDPTQMQRVLSPAKNAKAWDAFFVGDPYVLYVPDQV